MTKMYEWVTVLFVTFILLLALGFVLERKLRHVDIICQEGC